MPALGVVAALGRRDVAQHLRAEEAHAVLGVGHPAAGDGQKPDAGRAIANPPAERHRAAVAPLADHDVRFAGGVEERRDALRVVLAVGVEHHDRIG